MSLIDSQVKYEKGIQTVDDETLRIIYEEIQELSDMGENVQAKLLSEFVEKELVPGNLSSDINFDEAFSNWKQEIVKREVSEFAENWGIDDSILLKSFEQYSVVEKDIIPYIDEISKNIDYDKAKNKDSGSQLQHTIKLITEALPDWLLDMKGRYE